MRRRAVNFAAAARNDIEAIYDWVAESGSERNALTFIDRIERYCLGFDIASERGRIMKQSGGGAIRAVGYKRQATVVFRVEQNAVTILRIYRAGFDWLAEFDLDA